MPNSCVPLLGCGMKMTTEKQVPKYPEAMRSHETENKDERKEGRKKERKKKEGKKKEQRKKMAPWTGEVVEIHK